MQTLQAGPYNHPDGSSCVFAPTDHVLTLSHKAFACLVKENPLGTVIALYLPNQRRRLSPMGRRERKDFMSLRTSRMTIHNRRTAPIRQIIYRILGGATLTFAMLLGFVNPLWALQVSPSALTFSATSGGTDPSLQTVVLSNNRSSERTWMATANATWITVTPSSGTITTENDTVSVRTTAAGLAAGSYSASVTITETRQSGRIRRTVLPVTLSIAGAAATPTIQLSLSNLAFSGTAGGVNPAPKTFSISNAGGGTLAWTASNTAAWLILSPASGTNSSTVTTSVNLTGLAAGTYSATVSITATGATTKTIPVTLTLTAATLAPAIGLNTTSLGFAGTVGGANPTAQTIGISNAGGGTLAWTAGDNVTWLTLSPSSGTNAGTVTATVNLAGLLAGSYTATVTVTATGATPKTVPVTLTVTGSTSGGTIGFSPANLAFSGTIGGTNPAAKTFNITNTGGGTLSWTVSDNATWLQLTPASGTTTTETDTISASVTLNGLAAGTYNAIITVTASGSTNSPQQIPVSLTLSVTAAGTANLTWNTSTESDLTGYKVYRATASGTYGAPLATLPKTTTTYTATELQTGTTYFFVITAYDSSGNESTFSNEVSKSIF